MSKATTPLLIAALLVGIGTAANVRADALDDARALMRDGRHSEALRQINDHISRNPEDAGARFLKGVALTELGQRRDAVEVFLGMTRDFPDRPEPYNNLAVLRAMDGELEAARLALLEAIRIHPSYATAHENLGDVYARLAAEAFANAARLDATNASAPRKLALVSGVSKPAQAAAAVPTVPASGSSAQDREDVLDVVIGWMNAWTNQDVEAYLSHYSAGFTPAHGASREDWASVRRNRLTKPAFINVQVNKPSVQFRGEKLARVQFTQTYQSDTYSDEVVKRLDLVNENGAWKISRETTVN